MHTLDDATTGAGAGDILTDIEVREDSGTGQVLEDCDSSSAKLKRSVRRKKDDISVCRSYLCDECGVSFPNPRQMKQHVQQNHKPAVTGRRKRPRRTSISARCAVGNFPHPVISAVI